jgi:hypothetical protein
MLMYRNPATPEMGAPAKLFWMALGALQYTGYDLLDSRFWGN